MFEIIERDTKAAKTILDVKKSLASLKAELNAWRSNALNDTGSSLD